jgi:hypothetical protein
MERNPASFRARAVTGVYSRPAALPSRNRKRDLETLLEMVPGDSPIVGELCARLEEYLAEQSADADGTDF